MISDMISLEPPFRLADAGDAPVLARLIADASWGLAEHVWAQDVGQDRAWDHGSERMAKRAAAGEWVVAVEGDAVIAGLMGHAQPAAPEPIPDDMEPMFVPLQELENLAPATWYVHVLATLEGHRAQGWGGRLLDIADARAAAAGLTGLSVIVGDLNLPARRLYTEKGYRELARRPCIGNGWQTEIREWILMVKGAGTLPDPDDA